ncbi:MAG: hypothetical protein OEY09_01545 [Gammaproteobacteria bacterium]|nr:hypothetical protein [Gammaproteobacteria bacterium]
MIRKYIVIPLGFLLATFNAQAVEIGVGVKAGTIGQGVEVSLALTQTINARVSLTSIEVDDQQETVQIGTGTTADIDAVLGFDFGATALLFDWYVFDGTFHLTAGFMKNDTKLSFSGTLLGPVTLDSGALAPGDINGDIGGSISLGESFQPYLGVGWGRKAGDGGGFALTAEIGVALLDPNANLTAEVIAGGTNNLSQADLDARLTSAESDVNSELALFEAWPVITLGLNYGF